MTADRRYDRVAEEASAVVIQRYSTSFGLASRLLAANERRHVSNIYAFVRVADELVDGAGEAAGLSQLELAQTLTALEAEVALAIEVGFSTNLVVHAFALTAREAGFGDELTTPFFESMRLDLTETVHDAESFERYVYGSAEVVGLMCLQVFLLEQERTSTENEKLKAGARALGAAFQKVNFLRDLGADFDALGRSYFPGIDVESFSEAEKVRLLDDIDADLATSAAALPLLPRGSRRAVALAQFLFAELSRRLRATPAAELRTRRVRVPNPVKARLALRAASGRLPQ
jgi:15-cis-phytoene synthase